MEEGSLVFNTKYKSLAAEWLGLTPGHLSKPVDKASEETLLPGQSSATNAKKHTKVKTKELKQKEVKLPSVEAEVGEKLQKKLLKAKRHSSERTREHRQNVQNESVFEEEEERKSDVVCKKSKLDQKKNGQHALPLTVSEVKAKLKSPTLSKSVRKKLRKKLRLLEQREGTNHVVHSPSGQKAASPGIKTGFIKPSYTQMKSKEIDDFAKSFQKNFQQASRSVNHDEPGSPKVEHSVTHFLTPRTNTGISNVNDEKVKESKDSGADVSKFHHKISKKKRKHHSNFAQKRDEEHKVITQGQDGNFKHKETVATEEATEKSNILAVTEEKKRKRKHTKKRSKQKNIKKDHRPEEMKPVYLQGAGSKRVKKVTSPKKPDAD